MGTITNISNSAYQLLNSRVAANDNNFYVYLDADSGFNHGFPSGFFGDGLISINAGCIDDPADPNVGCFPSTDTTDFDATRGTVLQITFPSLPGTNFAGLNIEEPQNFGVLNANHECGVTVTCNGYDLRGATAVQFDVRSPTGINVQFAVGGCKTPSFVTLPPSQTYTHWSLALNTTSLTCTPDLTSVNLLFAVIASNEPNGASILIDNIQFTPAPARMSQGAETFDLPLSTKTFGVVPQISSVPPDQVNRNVAAIYESALTLLSLLHRAQPDDLNNAREIANALEYALYNDNHGDPLPISPTNSNGCYGGSRTMQCGLHNAYEHGDIGLLNSQGAGPALAGDVRLAGFEIPTIQPAFDLVLDGATGGNNAFAVLALANAYQQIPGNNVNYLNDALAIANWIVANLRDNTGNGYGGFYLGYPDMGCIPKILIASKSTENNADIFAAFSLLAQIEMGLGNSAAAAYWTNEANAAGNLVMAMFDTNLGRFNAGTVSSNANYNANGCPVGSQIGDDILDPMDFLDANSFTTMGLAASSKFGISSQSPIDWQQPLNYILNFAQAGDSFTQDVTVSGMTFTGFGLVPAPLMTGVAWEFTGQVVGTCDYVDLLLNATTFQSCAQNYLNQILQAANSAPFGDGIGLVASTRQNGDTLPPVAQCLQTPYQCIPERVGLAATNWAIFANEGFNPISFPALTVSESGTGTGTVTSGDGFINCGTVCSYSYFSGTRVTLTATPSQGLSFTGWSGCDSSNANSCTVTMAASRTVTATFVPTQAAITSPANGSTLSGSTVTFNWTAGTGAISYQLWVGSTVGGHDIAVGITTGLSTTISGLPTDGHALYVRLYSYNGSTWSYSSDTYTAASSNQAAITSPANGSTLSGSTVTFNWTAGTGAISYQLWVGSTVGGHDIAVGITTGLSTTISGLPTDGRTLYVRLYSYNGSTWTFSPYTYKAATGG
ncbi:MAG: hypothetical protein WAN69_02495 [Candidatus Korobacteraceae bacterium]